MGRMYTAKFSSVAVSASVDVFELTAPSDAVIVIHRAEITDETSETSEQAFAKMKRGIGATSGSSGGSATISKHQTGDGATGATVETNNTSKMTAGGGSIEDLGSRGFNWLTGFQYTPTPEERYVISPGERFAIEIPAPAASRTISGELVFEEIGG